MLLTCFEPLAAAHCYPYVFLTLLEDLEGARISSPTWSGI
jgi:hypothetical protein